MKGNTCTCSKKQKLHLQKRQSSTQEKEVLEGKKRLLCPLKKREGKGDGNVRVIII